MFFDPSSEPEGRLVSLADLELNDGVDRQFEGAGYVLAVHADKNDEDEGQEDDDDSEEPSEDEDSVDGKGWVKRRKAPYVHLGAIFNFSIDFSSINE